ncbi:F-box domain-containing protein [Favolaschia claudopus]|uniref:F-box domain-containing protein n=1 Tax=Favolaschia claudopus TaxID=2862362 RepID=A0AAW0CT48_9AGAR
MEAIDFVATFTDVNPGEPFRLLDLPPEIFELVFTFLPIGALLSVQRCSRFLRDFVDSSVALQYQILTEKAQVTDNAESSMPITDRIGKLLAREKAFGKADPSWRISLPIMFSASGLYELSGGMFWLGESHRKALRFIELPSTPFDEDNPPRWRRIALPSGASTIVDFGLAIEEHDLIVMATITPTDEDDMNSLKLEFFTVSEPNQPHPKAQGPIEVERTKLGPPGVILEVVGEHLVFAVTYGFAPGRQPSDSVYVYEWKTRKLKLKLTAECRTYFGVVFLSPDIIMLPNTVANRLELYSISSDQQAPLLTLHLPRLVPGLSIRTMTARGEPNPQASFRRPSHVPFHSSVEDSIVIFHVHFAGPAQIYQFLLFIHRRALLKLLADHSPGDTVDYADWGSDLCRWINATGLVMDWITQTSGQRCVLLPQRSPTLILLDFNPHKTRANPLNCIPNEDDAFEDYGIWAEPVGSRLPCFVVGSKSDEGDLYAGASLDDHRIIAIRRNLMRRVCELDILYFG